MLQVKFQFFLLVSEAEETGLSLALSEKHEDRFFGTRPIWAMIRENLVLVFATMYFLIYF